MPRLRERKKVSYKEAVDENDLEILNSSKDRSDVSYLNPSKKSKGSASPRMTKKRKTSKNDSKIEFLAETEDEESGESDENAITLRNLGKIEILPDKEGEDKEENDDENEEEEEGEEKEEEEEVEAEEEEEERSLEILSDLDVPKSGREKPKERQPRKRSDGGISNRRKRPDTNIPPISNWLTTLLGPRPENIVDFEHIEQLKVYENVKCRIENWRIIDSGKAEEYLPTRKSPVSIRLGAEMEGIPLPFLQSRSINPTIPHKKGFILNVGGSIWALDWCPIPPKTLSDSLNVQYLAVGGYTGTTDEHHGLETQQNRVAGCIQIWRVDCNVGKQTEGEATPIVEPVLEMCIVHEFGVVYDLKWCPYGTFEPDAQEDLPNILPKLGILAGSFGDGSLKLFAIPHPSAYKRLFKKMPIRETQMDFDMSMKDDILYVQVVAPLCDFRIPTTSCWTIGWGGPDKILTGCTNGNLALWDVEGALREVVRQNLNFSSLDLADYLIACFPAHDSCVRSVAWRGVHDPTHFVTCGHDGRVLVFDIRDVWTGMGFFRARAFIHAVQWPIGMDGVLFHDNDGDIRSIRTNDGEDLKTTTGLISHRGCVWSIASSNVHPFTVTTSSDGWVKMGNSFQLRTRSTRPTQLTLYRLDFNEATGVYRYLDNIKAVTYSAIKEETVFYLFVTPEVSIQRAAWNPNTSSAAWVATGGAAGLCRVEFTGRGDW